MATKLETQRIRKNQIDIGNLREKKEKDWNCSCLLPQFAFLIASNIADDRPI